MNILGSVCILFVFILTCHGIYPDNGYGGFFFHLADIHYDTFSFPEIYNVSSLCRNPHGNFTAHPPHFERVQTHNEFDFPSPLTNGQFGRFGCDSPLPLVQSMIESMAQVNSTPNFIMITGDYAGHNFPSESAIQNASNAVINDLVNTFPNTKLIVSLGNDDFYGDYNATCYGDMYTYYFKLFSAWIPDNQMSWFLQTGCYVDSPAEGLVIISLNTILFANKNPNNFSSDPCGVFNWLNNQLKDAQNNGSVVYIMGHIPPGMDSYAGKIMWKQNFLETFYGIVANYTNIITGMFFGHLHKDEFRVQSGVEIPMLLASSLSPLYLNDPSFRIFKYNTSTFELMNYYSYYLDLFKANEIGSAEFVFDYDFNSEYNMDGVNYKTVQSALNLISNDAEYFMKWMAKWSSEFSTSRVMMLCALETQDLISYTSCMKQYQSIASRKRGASHIMNIDEL